MEEQVETAEELEGGGSAVKCCPLDMMWLLHVQPSSDCSYLYKTSTRKGGRAPDSSPLAEELLAADGY